MTDSDFLAIERLFSDFAWYADRGNGVLLAELFLPNGILCVGDLELTGRSQIAEDCHRRSLSLGRQTRHVWSNLRIDRSDADAATSTAVQVTFEQNVSSGEPTQIRVSDLFDTLKKDLHGEWRFVRRFIKREIALST